MSLAALASLVVRSGASGLRTPVLVVPPSLSLKRQFFVALCDELIIASHGQQGDRADAVSSQLQAIQIDWVRGRGDLWSVISDRLARKWGERIAAHVTKSSGVPCRFQLSASISRPSPQRQALVLGLSDTHVALSPWTHPIYLSNSDLNASPHSYECRFRGYAGRTSQQHDIAAA